jgi:hypothetical protein
MRGRDFNTVIWVSLPCGFFRSTIVVMSSSYTRLALRRIETRFGSIRPKHRPGGRLNVAAHRLPSGI